VPSSSFIHHTVYICVNSFSVTLKNRQCIVVVFLEFDRPDESHHVKVLSPETPAGSSLLPTGT